MNSKIFTTLLVATLAFAGVAVAQGPSGNERGMDNEFGSVRLPYTVEVNGNHTEIVAKIVLRKNFEDKEATFYMFAWSVRGTPLDVTFDKLVRADTGKTMACGRTEGESNDQVKCFVDRKNMPPAGTEISMRGSVGSSRTGSFNVGAILQPFTYNWDPVVMANGLDAQLYGDTQVSVQSTTGGSGNRLGGLGNAVPGVGAVGAIVAIGIVAVGLAAMRRGRQD